MTHQAMRQVTTYTHRVHAKKEQVFPLLCPERECMWLAGWAYQMVYTDSGWAEPDCVFRTDFPGMGPAIWVVSHQDAEAGCIAFIITYPNTHVEHLQVRLREIDDALVELVWKRTYTSLTDAGRTLVERLTGPAFLEKMDWVARSLDHYCRTGTRLSLPHGS